MADNASLLCIHLLSPSVGDIYTSTWSQVLQGSHHKVYVIPHFTHIPHGVPHAHWCHSCLPHSTTKAPALLVCNTLRCRFFIRMFMLILVYMHFDCCRMLAHSHEWSYFVSCKSWPNEDHNTNCACRAAHVVYLHRSFWKNIEKLTIFLNLWINFMYVSWIYKIGYDANGVKLLWSK